MPTMRMMTTHRFGACASQARGQIDDVSGIQAPDKRTRSEPQALAHFYRAKIGPNFQTRCSEGSNSASKQASDQQKRYTVDGGTASHAEGHWFDPSRDHKVKACFCQAWAITGL